MADVSSDQSSIRTIIVLEFNLTEELIDSKIIAVHQIVKNMKKRGVGRGPKGRRSRALDRWRTMVRNSYRVSRVNETRKEKRMISRGRKMIWNWWVYRGLEGLGCRVPHLECIKDSDPFLLRFIPQAISPNVSSSRAWSPRISTWCTHKSEKNSTNYEKNR